MKLHRQHYGAGRPLIILHGLLGSLTNWTTLSKQFGAAYHVIAVDQRNHGGSPHSADMRFAAMADDLRELVVDEDLAAAHVLGHSMGGKTAMEFALRYPALVERLVVVDIAPRAYPPHHDAIFAGLDALDLGAATSRGELDAVLAQNLPDRGVRQFLLTNVQRDDDGRFRWRIDLPAIKAAYSGIVGAIQADEPFNGPTLFVRGEHSDYIQPADEPEIRALFPAATVQTIPGAGHWVHAEAPAVFAQVVLGFLAGS
jgi:esterase